MSGDPEPKDFKTLQADFAWRKRRYLHMIMSREEDAAKDARRVPARIRKYVIDGQLLGTDPGKGWVRLRTAPKDEWRQRITPANRQAKDERVNIPYATLWTDDPVARLREGGLDALRELLVVEDRLDVEYRRDAEMVNEVGARMALAVLETQAPIDGPEGEDDSSWVPQQFPPSDFYVKLPAPNERASVKVLLQIIFELAIVQMGGDADDPMHGKNIKEVLLHRVSHIVYDPSDSQRYPIVIDPLSGKSWRPDDPLALLTPSIQAFLKTLHHPVDPTPSDQRGDFIARWLGVFPGVDPGRLLDEFGQKLSNMLLTIRHLCPSTTEIARVVDLFAWLGMIAQEPLRVSLPAVSDMLAFKGEPLWKPDQSSWDANLTDKAYVPPAPAPADSLTDGDDILYRTLVCQAGNADPNQPRFFRMPDDPNPERPKPPPFVPSGWSWPTTDGNFIYWWRSVLRHHCAEHLLALKETADFHAVFLLRFCYLFQLFGAQPDVRVPGYVAAGIKAALLQFKYWWDEPAADSKNEKVREMTFWSENHQIQFHASQFLAGQLFLDDVFPRSGFMADGKPVTGREHLRRGRERLERWLNRRLALGFSEWNAPGYYNEDFPAVLNVVDFSLDETIATKAAMVADLLVFDLARNTCRGSFGVTAGRAYFEHKAYGWEQSVGETIEVLFGTRGDHLGGEATAIALCTSPKYQVPDALLAIGRDRLLLDQFKPMEFRARVSIEPEEAQAHGIGFESDDDAGFWWGLGAYFDPKTLELTRGVARRNHNIHKTNPPGLLFKLDIDLEFLDYFKALLQDAAGAAAGGAGAAGTSFLLLAPFPLNIVAGIAHIASIALLIEGLWNLIEDLAIMIKNSLEVAWDFATGQDPPKPDIPQPALQRAWEAMLQTFNAGNMLSRANLYTYSVGDAMLSSAQNHRAKQISLQKQPWLASLGCDACVWTNAPMDPDVFGSIGSAGWEVFKHLVTAQFTRAAIDIAAWGQVAGDELKEEGLRDWGGSICLPKVVQHRGAAIIAYEFPDQRSEFSAKLTHAWFPSEFFDEVTPAPENEDWLTERDGGGTWVFGRKDDGYIALCSARRVKWLRDNRFKDDPTNPISTDPVWEGRFTSTELRAENGSNIWICAIGNRTQFGSFELFAAKIRAAEVHFSGVGTGVQLQCTFDMPAAPGTGEPGFRWELFFGDDEAHLNGVLWHLEDYPRFEGRYVAGLKPGRVEWGETSYKLVHPITGLWVSHDTSRTHREIGPSAWDTLLPLRTSSPKVRAAVTLMPIREAVISTASPKLSGRARRFRLKTDD